MTVQDSMTIDAMRKYGGSFVTLMAASFVAADPENRGKLKNTFEAEFNRYLEIAKADQKREAGHD